MSVDWLPPGTMPPGVILTICTAPTNAEWAEIDRAMGAGIEPAIATLGVLGPVGKIGALALRPWYASAEQQPTRGAG